jgi:hypothetical protein
VIDSRILEGMCREILDGFGDANAGEWTDDRPRAFHLRRRLSAIEQQRVGAAVDCRCTLEASERFEKIRHLLPPAAIQLAAMELSETRA